ncbi:MAG: uroporphyrinogen decarboxylase family protein [Candidatus Brocadiia bacterium]
MPQSPREVVHAAVHFEGPERLPVRMACFECDDTIWIPRKSEDHEEGGVKVDEWGCRWEKTAMHNMGQPKGHPLSDVTEHARARIPDYNEQWRYEGLEEVFEQAEREERYTQVGIFMVLFERMHSLAGFENVLMGLLADRENTAALADRILDAQMCLVRNYQERFGDRLHSFSMTDDWGTQEAAFISADLWYDFFLPRYRKLFDLMHSGGQDVWVHSCGKINEIVQGFIDAGCDVINLQQPRALGIPEMGERYRGAITFESLSDIQASLPTGRAERIREDARMLGEHWMKPEGGFVFSDYGDDQAIGAGPDAKLTMYRAFSEVSQRIYGRPLPEPRVPVTDS